jgi:hypothetical protein
MQGAGTRGEIVAPHCGTVSIHDRNIVKTGDGKANEGEKGAG